MVLFWETTVYWLSELLFFGNPLRTTIVRFSKTRKLGHFFGFGYYLGAQNVIFEQKLFLSPLVYFIWALSGQIETKLAELKNQFSERIFNSHRNELRLIFISRRFFVWETHFDPSPPDELKFLRTIIDGFSMYFTYLNKFHFFSQAFLRTAPYTRKTNSN